MLIYYADSVSLSRLEVQFSDEQKFEEADMVDFQLARG